jgi:hypothetical protein
MTMLASHPMMPPMISARIRPMVNTPVRAPSAETADRKQDA